MAMFAFVALNDQKNCQPIHPKELNGEPKSAAEAVRKKLGESKRPEVLYDGGDKSKPLIFGRDKFEAGHIYVWQTIREVWEDQEIVQNALYCSDAIYLERPHENIRNKQSTYKFTNITEILAVGMYGNTRCCIALSGADKNRQSLIVSFRGSENEHDWKTNFSFGMVEDQKWIGKIHEGFLKRSNKIDINDIKKLSYIHQVERIITCGHSLGGSISSLVHLALVNDSSEEDGELMPEMVNVTFGAPLFANNQFKKEVEAKGYTRNMYHFTSSQDIVPITLSIGHTFKVVKEEIVKKASQIAGGLVKTASDWIASHSEQLAVLENACINILEAVHTSKDGSSDTFLNFLRSYEHLKQSRPSSLYNSFEENDYVPIGKFILLSKTDGKGQADELTANGKIIERVLQAATEMLARKMSFREIVMGHQMSSYMHRIKDAFGGLKMLQGKRVQIYKTPIDDLFSNLSFENPCKFICAYSGCEECHAIPFHEQEERLVAKVVYCKTCQDDPEIEEYYFHQTCSDKYHVETTDVDKSSHAKSPVDLKNIAPELRKEILLESSDVKSIAPYLKLGDVGKFLGQTTIQILRSSNALNKVIYLGGEIAESASFKAASVKWNAYISLGVFAVSSGINFNRWCRGLMTGKEFMRITLDQAGGALGGFAGGVLGGKIGLAAGAFFGPIGAVIGGFFGGIGGAIGGHLLGEKFMDYIARNWLGLEEDEDKQKADTFAESMIVLEIPNLNSLDEHEVLRCFRRKALQCHPDRLPTNISEEQKQSAQVAWHTFEMARDLLLSYCENTDCISHNIKRLIKKKLKEYNKDVNLDQLRKNIMEFQEQGPLQSVEFKKDN